ncbi:MAG: hypothetical protein U1F25_09785 [Rubrivivax sp.]
MSDASDNLLLEHLKRFQATLERTERKVDEVIYRIGQLELGSAAVRRDVAHNDDSIAGLSVRMDRVNERIDRIERRLEIA